MWGKIPTIIILEIIRAIPEIIKAIKAIRKRNDKVSK